MHPNPTIEQLQQVKSRHQAALLQLPNVTGLGIGYKETGGQTTDELALIVHVAQKKPLAALKPAEVVPPQIEGIPTDVQEIGPLRAY